MSAKDQPSSSTQLDNETSETRHLAEIRALECIKLKAENAKLSAETAILHQPWKNPEFYAATIPVLVAALAIIGAICAGWFDNQRNLLARDIEALKGQRDDLTRQIEGQKSEQQLLTNAIANSENEKRKLTLANSALKTMSESLESTLTALNASNGFLNAKIFAAEKGLENQRLEAAQRLAILTNQHATIKAVMESDLQARATSETNSKNSILALEGKLQEQNDKIARYEQAIRSFPGEGVASLLRAKVRTDEEWAIYGEPCHSDDGWNHQHPLMHNRQFDTTANPELPDARPQTNDVVVARDFVTVWNRKPMPDDKDEYLFYGKEQYPPDKSSSVLVPGERVRILQVYPIKFGMTFIRFTRE